MRKRKNLSCGKPFQAVFQVSFAIVLAACAGESNNEGGDNGAGPRPEQPAEVVYEQMKPRGMVATWEDHPYTGLARASHSDGSPRAEIPFKDGLRHGTVLEYYDSGQLSMRAVYVEGLRHGERRYFDQQGNPTKIQQWRDDEVVETLEGDELPDQVE